MFKRLFNNIVKRNIKHISNDTSKKISTSYLSGKGLTAVSIDDYMKYIYPNRDNSIFCLAPKHGDFYDAKY